MISKIFKYTMDDPDHAASYSFLMPPGSRIIHIGLDGVGRLCAWAIHDVDREDEQHQGWILMVFGTGLFITDSDTFEYLGSATQEGYVWHVFKVKL